jgi:pimeloyl-ACP methyl ester carboxylesterase
MKINSLEKITINHSDQWLLVRGANSDGPLILYVQAGPGLPMIPEANPLEKLLKLEDTYLVAYWDQRGCGKSFDNNLDPKTINFSQLSDDIIECTKCLLNRYRKKKAILIGYSIGATASLMAASKEPGIFSQLFLVGTDIDIPRANKYALEFAMTKAKEKNNRKLIEQIIRLGEEPILESKRFQERAKILTNLGGLKTGSNYNQLLLFTIKNMLFCKWYRFGDIPKTIKGIDFCQDALLPELNKLNLFDRIQAVQVPVHFIQGKLDGIAPYSIGVKFYEYLQVATKTFTSFDHSAHMPHYEEPGKFAELLNEKIIR